MHTCPPTVPRTLLGNTGIEVSRHAIGTGTHGWSGNSDQTRRESGWLSGVLVRGYELGINYWDLADQYGSHGEARRALASLQRNELVLCTKTTSSGYGACRDDIQRFLRELSTDYLDIVLLHCLTADTWPQQYTGAMQALSEAKAAGWVRAAGISSHGIGALTVAAEHPWVDALLVRLNYSGDNMDGSPRDIVRLTHRALAAGKGVTAMKVLGCGSLAHDPRRAISWVFDTGQVHAVTIGPTEDEQMEQCASWVAAAHTAPPL